MLKEAMPRQAVEALEGEVRKLISRIDSKRHAGADAADIAGIERGLAEVRDALRGLTPAENLVGFEDAVNHLSQKIDRIGSSHDPAALKQLEGAIVALRGVVSSVASDHALATLADEVRTSPPKSTRSPAPTFLDHRAADRLDRGRAAGPQRPRPGRARPRCHGRAAVRQVGTTSAHARRPDRGRASGGSHRRTGREARPVRRSPQSSRSDRARTCRPVDPFRASAQPPSRSHPKATLSRSTSGAPRIRSKRCMARSATWSTGSRQSRHRCANRACS